MKSKKTINEMSPAEQARMAEIREIGQKMRDVNNIFTTGQKMNDKVLVAGARQKLAQLAKQKHDLETQPVAEGKKDKTREEGTYTLVFSSDQKPYSWGKFWAKSKEEAKQRAKDIFKKHGFTNVNIRELAIKESIEEDNIGGIQTKRVSGPGATVGQVDEMFADQGAGHSPENSSAAYHRVGVTVVDPTASDITKRKEKIQKTIRMKGDADTAVKRATKYYENKGYRVLDAWYIEGYNKVSVTEGNEGVDTIEMDVELFIRCLEWAKENAPDDIALHKFTENVVAKNGILTMSDYESLVPQGAPVEEDKYEDEEAKYANIEKIATKRSNEIEKTGDRVYMINSYTDPETKRMAAELLIKRKDGTKDKEIVREDASAGATGSASVATVVSGTPGIIRRVGKGKKKGLYGNSVNPQTFTSALGKGIYEAEEKKKGEEKFDYDAWKKSGDKSKKPRGKHSEKTLLGKGKNGWNKVSEAAMQPGSKFVTIPHEVWSAKSPEDQARLKAKHPNLKVTGVPKAPRVPKPKKNYEGVQQAIDAAIGDAFPDGDPIDLLFDRYSMEELDKAVRSTKSGKNYNDYIKQAWQQNIDDSPERWGDMENPW